MISWIIFVVLTGITFSWDANAPADKVTGYRLKVGPGDGTYPVVVDAGNALSKVMPDDPKYRTAVVTAYNSEGIESAPSEAYVFRPQSPGGLRVKQAASAKKNVSTPTAKHSKLTGSPAKKTTRSSTTWSSGYNVDADRDVGQCD